jgi:hypothetical protein
MLLNAFVWKTCPIIAAGSSVDRHTVVGRGSISKTVLCNLCGL